MRPLTLGCGAAYALAVLAILVAGGACSGLGPGLGDGVREVGAGAAVALVLGVWRVTRAPRRPRYTLPPVEWRVIDTQAMERRSDELGSGL